MGVAAPDRGVNVDRPLAMLLAGRFGLAFPLVLFGAVTVALFGVDGEVPPPLFFVGVLGVAAFDWLGGVRVTEGSIRFRRYVRFADIPLASVRAVGAYRRGLDAVPVVTLKLHDGKKVSVSPMRTYNMKQARRVARDLAGIVGADPPSKNWDGS